MIYILLKFKKFFYLIGKDPHCGCISFCIPCSMCCFRYKLREKKKINVKNLTLFFYSYLNICIHINNFKFHLKGSFFDDIVVTLCKLF